MNSAGRLRHGRATRRLAVALTAAVAVAPGLASAQDRDGWSGLYIGIQAGGSRSELSVAATDQVTQLTNIDPPGAQPLTIVPALNAPFAARDRETAATFGAFMGWQGQSGAIVYGVEADIRAGDSTLSAQTTLQIPATLLSPSATLTLAREAQSDVEWSLRGRLGYATGRSLIYAAGGVAGTKADVSVVNSYTIPAGNAGNPTQAFPAQGPFLVAAQQSEDLIGWTAGLGFEQRLGRHVRLGVEGRYTDYGDATLAFANAARTNLSAPAPAPFTATTGEGAFPGSTSVSLNSAQLMVRLSYGF